MVTPNDGRWRLRFQNFGRALGHLERACQQEEYSELERAGLAQMFGFTFELAWKTLKDLLLEQGYGLSSPREAVRQSFSAGYISEAAAEALLDALLKRNLLSHTYDEETAELAVAMIKQSFAPALRSLYDSLNERTEE
jgi:nucleotidyltransferase substrate binding protein (TIGR01987 family)